MTKQKFKTLALSALLATTFALPALAEEGAAGGPPMMGMEHKEDGPGGKGPGGERFMRADANKDGFLTKDEMLAEHKKHLDEMFANSDTNHDGKLSKEELKNGREAMRAKMKERMQEWKDKRGERMERMKERMGEKSGETPVEGSTSK